MSGPHGVTDDLAFGMDSVARFIRGLILWGVLSFPILIVSLPFVLAISAGNRTMAKMLCFVVLFVIEPGICQGIAFASRNSLSFTRWNDDGRPPEPPEIPDTPEPWQPPADSPTPDPTWWTDPPAVRLVGVVKRSKTDSE